MDGYNMAAMNWQLPCGAHPLAPFDHQVAGQSSFLLYDETTICKPLKEREQFVYKTLPEGLKEFTPEYRGEIEVHLAEKDGFVLLYGLDVNNESTHAPCGCSFEESNTTLSSDMPNAPEKENNNKAPTRDILGLKSVEAPQNQCMIRVLHSESYEVCPPAQGVDHGDVRAQYPRCFNPWSLRNHKRLLDKMRKSENSQNSMRFILLENAIADFKYPCILDLKIGSRLHGDDADQVKVETQSRRSRETTSYSIGVRLCGMQVYQQNTGTCTSYDKYHGRTLTDETLKKALVSFLHNGVRSRKELLEPIVFQLSKLINCLRSLSTYRFYGSSILISYDGQETNGFLPVAYPPTRIRAPSESANDGLNLPHQTIGNDSKEESHSISTVSQYGKTCHENYLNDKESFSHLDCVPSDTSEKQFQSPAQEVSEGRTLSKPSLNSQVTPANSPQLLSHQNIACEQFHSEELNLSTRKSSCEPMSCDASNVCSPEESVNDEPQAVSELLSVTHDLRPPSSFPKVNVQMIDFVHTTHEGFPDDKVRHEGPDLDYINGLTNVKELFKQILCSS